MINVKQNRKLWVNALRSGKYTQTTRKLRIVNSFCCLGVACDLVDPDAWSKNKNDVSYWYDSEIAYDAFGMLSETPMKHFGIRTSGGTFHLRGLSEKLQAKCVEILNSDYQNTITNDDTWSLATLNDSGASFSLIADIIEEEPEGMFV